MHPSASLEVCNHGSPASWASSRKTRHCGRSQIKCLKLEENIHRGQLDSSKQVTTLHLQKLAGPEDPPGHPAVIRTTQLHKTRDQTPEDEFQFYRILKITTNREFSKNKQRSPGTKSGSIKNICTEQHRVKTYDYLAASAWFVRKTRNRRNLW